MSERVQEREINLVDMFWAICLKWRIILLVALISATFAGAYSYRERTKSIIEQNEFEQNAENLLNNKELEQANLYFNYEQACNQQIEYNNQSLWMNLDPNGFYKGEITFFVENQYSVERSLNDKDDNISGIIQAYENILDDKLFRNELIRSGVFEESNVAYLDEMVNCDVAQFETINELRISDIVQQDENIIIISIFSQDIEVCNKVMAQLEEQIVAQTPGFQKQFGEHNLILVNKSCNLTADSKLLTFQRTNIERANSYLSEKSKLYNSLSENAKNYVDKQEDFNMQRKHEISWKMVIIGFVAGTMIVAFFYAIVYVFNTKLRMEDDFEALYSVKLLGNVIIDANKKKKWFAFVDNFIEKQRHRNRRYFPEAEAMKMLAAGIRIAAKKENIHQVYITGNVMLEKENAVAQKLADILKKDAIEVLIGRPILYDADALEKNAEIGNVILLETSDGSMYNEIGTEIQTCIHQNVNILGAIVVA